MKSLFTLIAMSLLVGTATMGQLNTANPLYLSLLAGSISYGDESPYAIPKKVVADKNLFRASENIHYKTANYLDAKFAVFQNNRGKRRAYQILSVHSTFTLLCEHYVKETCDCFEGLHILAEGSAEPSRIRSIWPFSLKLNLVDAVEANSGIKLEEETFESVCAILEFLGRPQ